MLSSSVSAFYADDPSQILHNKRLGAKFLITKEKSPGTGRDSYLLTYYFQFTKVERVKVTFFFWRKWFRERHLRERRKIVCLTSFPQAGIRVWTGVWSGPEMDAVRAGTDTNHPRRVRQKL
jgi:hypothetical protein